MARQNIYEVNLNILGTHGSTDFVLKGPPLKFLDAQTRDDY